MVGMVLNIMVSHQWGCPCPCQAAHSYSDLFSQADIVEARYALVLECVFNGACHGGEKNIIWLTFVSHKTWHREFLMCAFLYLSIFYYWWLDMNMQPKSLSSSLCVADELLFEETLSTITTDLPDNHTILFRYIADVPVSYVELKTNYVSIYSPTTIVI